MVYCKIPLDKLYVSQQPQGFLKTIPYRNEATDGPEVTAQSFVLYDCNSKSIELSKKPTYKREVASITKMMTLLTTIRVMARYGIEGNKTYIRVSKQCSKIIGTSAELKEGDLMTVDQLMYGMMLPSGNDAAFALAEYFGG